MGNSIAVEEIRSFLNLLGQKYTQPVKLYLLGGSALCFLGSPRRTIDIDYVIELPSNEITNVLNKVAYELYLEVEFVPIDEFIPLPPNAAERHQLIEKFGNIEVYIFDPYSIALSKIARGFEADIQDVLFLLKRDFIDIVILDRFVDEALTVAWDYDIDPNDLKTHLDVVKKLFQ